MSENKSKMSILTNGILNENPVLRLVLGTCPTLAVTTMASNGIGMGLAATFVLLCSNIVISALRKIIPDQVRIPCYITVIAGFVSIVQMIVKAYVPDLDKALGVYLPLIVDGRPGRTDPLPGRRLRHPRHPRGCRHLLPDDQRPRRFLRVRYPDGRGHLADHPSQEGSPRCGRR